MCMFCFYYIFCHILYDKQLYYHYYIVLKNLYLYYSVNTRCMPIKTECALDARMHFNKNTGVDLKFRPTFFLYIRV